MAPLIQKLREAMSRHYPDAVCLGDACYIRLDSSMLAKAELTTSGNYYSGLRLTILNRRTGPVDSIRLDSLSRSAPKTDCGEAAAWDVCRPTLDIEVLSELAEEYVRLFREPDPK